MSRKLVRRARWIKSKKDAGVRATCPYCRKKVLLLKDNGYWDKGKKCKHLGEVFPESTPTEEFLYLNFYPDNNAQL